MKIGLHVGTRGAALNSVTLLTIADKTGTLGFSHLGFSDHLVIANKVDSPYPYTKSRVWFAQDSGDCLDQLTTLAFVAAGTTSLRLLTSVMVIPHRPPMLTAKMLATADILSRGRVTVGVGAGCLEEKINLLGVLTFKRRGKLVYETLAAMRTFWTDADPVFEGEFVFQRSRVRAEARAKAASANLGRWRGKGRAPARRTGRVSGWQQPVLAKL